MESYKLYNEHLSNSGLKFSPRGSEADLFAPTPTAVANAPATAAHFGGATGAANQASQAMLSSHLASQLAVAGVSTGALSVPGAAAGGYGLSPASSMNMFSQVSPFMGNDAKKVKLDTLPKQGIGNAGTVVSSVPTSSLNGGPAQLANQQLSNITGSAPPSKYVAICNLPDGTSQAEIISLGAKEGKITAAAVMEMKKQGYLEFEDERSAVAMVSRCRNSPPVYRGNQLIVNFGSAKDMKSMVNSAPTFITSPGMGASGNGSSPDISPMSSGMGGSVGGDERTVLRVIVEMGENQNIYNQVNLDVLQHLFSRTGFVMKIITFAKPGYPQQFQALIQYMEPKSAQTAKELFDGQNLYYGCCPLKVEYSKLTNLNVKYNNEKSRDFMRPDLPTGENPSIIPSFNDHSAALALAQAGVMPATFSGLTSGVNQFGTAATALNPAAAAALGPLAFSPHQICDPHLTTLYYLNLQLNANAAAASGLSPAAAVQNAAFLQQLNRTNPVAAALASLPSAVNPSVATNMPTNSVLLVGNLNTEKVTCDGLFTLFGVYGDVQRVKILFNKQDSALIQMSSEAQANLCIENLNEMKVYGKEMRVALSKHQLVQLPKEGQPDAGLTKDYSNSPLHRFRKQGSKNFQNIYPPSSTLHLSNIAPGASEENVLEAFTKKGVEVVSFRFFPDPEDNDHKMALLQCRSKEDAIIALIESHNYQLGENHHLRVSFSKTQMGAGGAGMAGGGMSGSGSMLSLNGSHISAPSTENIGGGCDGLNVNIAHC